MLSGLVEVDEVVTWSFMCYRLSFVSEPSLVFTRVKTVIIPSISFFVIDMMTNGGNVNYRLCVASLCVCVCFGG